MLAAETITVRSLMMDLLALVEVPQVLLLAEAFAEMGSKLLLNSAIIIISLAAQQVADLTKDTLAQEALDRLQCVLQFAEI